MLTTIGDMAQVFLTKRQTAQTKTDMNRLLAEVSSGLVADPAARQLLVQLAIEAAQARVGTDAKRRTNMHRLVVFFAFLGYKRFHFSFRRDRHSKSQEFGSFFFVEAFAALCKCFVGSHLAKLHALSVISEYELQNRLHQCVAQFGLCLWR